MLRSCITAATAVTLALGASNAGAADPLPTDSHKVLTAALAVEAAQAAIDHCKAQGYNVTVTVADRNGTPKVVIVRDGPQGVGTESTRRKAYTAAMLRVSTGDYTKRIANPGAFNPGVYDPELATGAGGVPIKAGEDTIGGIAAAGAPGGDKDEACAQAGVDKIKDRLN
ncbi:MAG TPA: heme-binding protein [Xanthobacteraceae bacterium]|nr:heme-binding protein [Xanthobacteraceae bacterium]